MENHTTTSLGVRCFYFTVIIQELAQFLCLTLGNADDQKSVHGGLSPALKAVISEPLFCVFFPISSSEQSLAAPLPLQLLSSLSSMPRKNPALAPQCFSPLYDSYTRHRGTTHSLIYPAVSFRRNCRVGNTQGCPMEKGRYISNCSWCSTGSMLICFSQCHGFFGECDLI